MPVKKVMATVQQQSVAKHRMVVDIYGHLHPEGQYNVLKSWLNGSSIAILAMPEGDILTAIDHNKVLLKT